MQSSAAAERYGRLWGGGWTSKSIVTETTTSTSYVTAATTATELVDCLDNQWMFTMDICNNSMGVQDMFFQFNIPTTTGAPTTTAATTTGASTTTAGTTTGVGKRRRRSADGTEIWEEPWDYEGEEIDGEEEDDL